MRQRVWRFAAVLLSIPSLAVAQDRIAQPGTGPQPPRAPMTGGPQVQPPRPSPQIQPPRPRGPQIQPPRPDGPQVQPPRPARPEVQPPRPFPVHARPPHYGHPTFHRPHHYRPHPYRYPHGYAYRRWHVGAVLPHILFGSAYYFNDYRLFGLYAPPLHYRWVRYGPDLILVNTRNGHVRDVYYGVFA